MQCKGADSKTCVRHHPKNRWLASGFGEKLEEACLSTISGTETVEAGQSVLRNDVCFVNGTKTIQGLAIYPSRFTHKRKYEQNRHAKEMASVDTQR